jgi:hypothetical protein
MKREANMSTELTGMTKSISGAGGALDDASLSKLGERLMAGVTESLVPKRGGGGCKKC